MKKTLFALAAFVLLVVTVNAQVVRDVDVPQSVKTKMTTMFPSASAVVWTKDMPGFITSDFVQSKTKMSATFTTSGSWVSTETSVKQEELPAAANQYLLTNFQDAKVTHCVIAESVKEKTYECVVKSKSSGAYDVVFDTEGNLKMKTVAEE